MEYNPTNNNNIINYKNLICLKIKIKLIKLKLLLDFISKCFTKNLLTKIIIYFI